MRDFGLRRGLGWVWGEEKCLLGAPAPEESWESWGKCLPRCRASRLWPASKGHLAVPFPPAAGASLTTRSPFHHPEP
eukprot:bmy_02208T0